MIEAHADQTELSERGQALLARLLEISEQPDRRIFAVMDGARFDNLPVLLRAADVAHRPLYRHAGGDYSIVTGGPWLVDPSRPAVSPLSGMAQGDHAEPEDADLSDEALEARSAGLSEQMMAALASGDSTGGGILAGDVHPEAETVMLRLEKILWICRDKAAIVFWLGDETLTEETLYRHLRGINRIVIPKTAASDDLADNRVELMAAGDEADERPSSEETVIFRHADPNVMVQLFSGLYEDQAARLFGPATEILFAPEQSWGGGVKRGRRPADIPTPTGHLRLVDENIGQIRALRLKTMREMRASYLQKCCADELVEATPGELADHVLVSEQTGKRLGLVSEAAHCRWAYLMFATRGQIAASPDIVSYIRDAGSSPDRQVGLVMKSTVAELRRQRAGVGING